MIGVTLLGLVAYFILPIARVPQVDVPTIRVSASLPGANAETMATSVAAPLESQLSLISGVTAISSTSSLGQTQIQVEFDLARSIEGAAQDVQAVISAAGGLLPKNLPNPPTYPDQPDGRLSGRSVRMFQMDHGFRGLRACHLVNLLLRRADPAGVYAGKGQSRWAGRS